MLYDKDVLIPLSNSRKQIYFDISILAQKDWNSGIQRIQKKILNEIQKKKSNNIKVVFFENNNFYEVKNLKKFLRKCNRITIKEQAIVLKKHSHYINLDLNYDILINSNIYENLKNNAIKIWFLVYDILPLEYPHFFPDNIKTLHQCYFEFLSHIDGIFTLSETVKDSIINYSVENSVRLPKYIYVLKIGTDNNLRSRKRDFFSYPKKSEKDLLKWVKNFNTIFLSVGTIEPRKNYSLIIDAFKKMEKIDPDKCWILAGQEGWNITDKEVQLINNFKSLNKNIFVIKGPSDYFLSVLYKLADYLIAASIDEGLGLPLLEAKSYSLPIIASNIPIFKEVLGENATYFSVGEVKELVDSISACDGFNSEKLKSPNAKSNYVWKDTLSMIMKLL